MKFGKLFILMGLLMAEGICKDNIYKARSGDFLKLISYKIYGDSKYWKDIYEWNKDKLGSRIKYTIRPDDKIKYKNNSEFPVHKWFARGEVYRIRRGDSLSTISSRVYETKKYQKCLKQNNPILVRNVDSLDAGLFLYYLEKKYCDV